MDWTWSHNAYETRRLSPNAPGSSARGTSGMLFPPSPSRVRSLRSSGDSTTARVSAWARPRELGTAIRWRKFRGRANVNSRVSKLNSIKFNYQRLIFSACFDIDTMCIILHSSELKISMNYISAKSLRRSNDSVGTWSPQKLRRRPGRAARGP